MKTVVLGSLNIDRTYRVNAFVRPKETSAAKEFSLNCGGKGYNQAVALARAGAEVHFAGAIGEDGELLWKGLKENGIHTEFLKKSSLPNGHAVIQVNDDGENCIIIVQGSNGEIDRDYIDKVLNSCSGEELLLFQNEVPNVDYAIEQAHKRGLRIAFNPSPISDAVNACKLEYVDILLVNEVEGEALGGESDSDSILKALHAMYPHMNIVLTLGGEGSCFIAPDGKQMRCKAVPSAVVDTTAAGDTFTGFFLTEFCSSGNAEEALRFASAASSIAVSRNGAAQSIPTRAEAVEVSLEAKYGNGESEGK